jgi:hypothetical protein
MLYSRKNPQIFYITPMTVPNTSPKWIKSLSENEIFVFGSNLAGFHGCGIAGFSQGYCAAFQGGG